MIPELEQHLENRLQLGALPSPLNRCQTFSTSAGLEVDLKRDDLIGDLVTGTKVRALSYILWQAMQDGVTDLITLGEPTSNQCRLVAMLAARHEMSAHILVRKSAFSPGEDENIAVMRLCGAHLQFLEEDEWRLHGMAVKRLMSRIRGAGGRALFVPFGCGGLPGALGIIDLVREIVAQHGGTWPYSHMLIPTGSGATLFALDLAMQLLDTGSSKAATLVGVSVAQDAASLWQQIDRLYAKTGRALGHDIVRSDRLAIDDSWRALSSAELLEQLQRVLDSYGILPDPLYVLRAFLALERLAATGEVDSRSRILLLVSGACRTLRAIKEQAMDKPHAMP